MKRITIIFAIVLIAFTVNAQSNRSRSDRSSSTEPARKEEVKRTDRSSQQTPRPSSSVNQRESRESKPISKPTSQNDQRKASSDERDRSYSTPSNESNRTVDPSGNRIMDQNRGGEQPRVRVEHPEKDNSRKVEDIYRSNKAGEKYTPKRGERFDAQRRTYSYNHTGQAVRPAPKTYYAYKPIEYRRLHHIYRIPPHRTIVWNARMYREYVYLYPEYRLWYYPYGYHIHTISAYDANRYIGEVVRVYGEIFDVWYSGRTDEYFLYIGGPYPYQDFSIVIGGHDARKFSSRPQRYFSGRHVAATGLIGIFEGKPEMFIRKRSQLDIY